MYEPKQPLSMVGVFLMWAVLCQCQAALHVSLEALVDILCCAVNSVRTTIVCSCRYIGDFFVAPNLSFDIRFLTLYHHVVRSTLVHTTVVCSCRYIGDFFVAPNLSFNIRFLTLYHHQYMLVVPPPSRPCLIFQQLSHGRWKQRMLEPHNQHWVLGWPLTRSLTIQTRTLMLIASFSHLFSLKFTIFRYYADIFQ